MVFVFVYFWPQYIQHQKIKNSSLQCYTLHKECYKCDMCHMIKRDHSWFHTSQYKYATVYIREYFKWNIKKHSKLQFSTVLFILHTTLLYSFSLSWKILRVVGNVNKTVEHMKSVLNTVERERTSQRSLI